MNDFHVPFQWSLQEIIILGNVSSCLYLKPFGRGQMPNSGYNSISSR